MTGPTEQGPRLRADVLPELCQNLVSAGSPIILGMGAAELAHEAVQCLSVLVW